MQYATKLRKLLLGVGLGNNMNHPLAGWSILTMLYRDSATSNEASTFDYIMRRYNSEYLDQQSAEEPVGKGALIKIMHVLVDETDLVTVNFRRVRVFTTSGKRTRVNRDVYRITSAGIEYMRAMQQVVDADTTVTANTLRIGDFCTNLAKLQAADLSDTTTRLFNNFRDMVANFDDVMKGMHKLDDDLASLTTNLAFNHEGIAAKQLRSMLMDKAIPAYGKMIERGNILDSLAYNDRFIEAVARSQQGSDDLNADKATSDEQSLVLRGQQVQEYVTRQLRRLADSFVGVTNVIDRSMDSFFALYQTIDGALQMLGDEYEHAQQQSVDVKALTNEIDHLLRHYQSIKIPVAIPRHLPYDRDVENKSDLLHAADIGFVEYHATATVRTAATEADNPPVVATTITANKMQAAFKEFRQQLMPDANHVVINQNVTFTTTRARDEAVRLYAAVKYSKYGAFAVFGRPVVAATALGGGPIVLDCAGEQFSYRLPQGFELTLKAVPNKRGVRHSGTTNEG
ncbi:hypothetical protein [Lacticaseibacillus hulanensis]|uniref:hypothetical protein n=1 Tax=Lacticaseibacillus hulanensis TaxID=2493111 RepID=UPI000FD7D066|nr:hypothetical protein [Lacticaseibacillus hulanensis]